MSDYPQLVSFRTRYDSHPRVIKNPGSPIRDIYSPVFSKDGTMKLEVTGQENIYEYIQSHAESVDIHVILAQYQNGDLQALQRRQAMYLDATQLPSNYAQVLQTVMQGEDSFSQLPLSVREKFGHDFGKWLAAMGTPEWLSAMGMSPSDATQSTPSVEDVTAPKVQEVKSE